MNWDDLRIFLAVTRTGTLAAAGQKLGIDPTTVARRIARLEAAVGRSLFEVTPSGHVPTSRAQELLSHVEAMESAVITGTEGATSSTQPTATVRVSVSEGFGTWIIAPHLHEFVVQNPATAVELVASTGFLNPSRREADIAIMLARPKRGPLVVRKLTDYQLGLYQRRDTQAFCDVSELAEQRLVGYVPDLIYAPELNYLDEVTAGLTASLSSTSINAQATIVRSGVGAGILPCFIGESDSELKRVLTDRISIQRSFWIVVHRDLRRVARVQRFIDWLDGLIDTLHPVLHGRGEYVQGSKCIADTRLA
jgi:DNA-binding transcriptional LysR family regulator